MISFRVGRQRKGDWSQTHAVERRQTVHIHSPLTPKPPGMPPLPVMLLWTGAGRERGQPSSLSTSLLSCRQTGALLDTGLWAWPLLLVECCCCCCCCCCCWQLTKSPSFVTSLLLMFRQGLVFRRKWAKLLFQGEDFKAGFFLLSWALSCWGFCWVAFCRQKSEKNHARPSSFVLFFFSTEAFFKIIFWGATAILSFSTSEHCNSILWVRILNRWMKFVGNSDLATAKAGRSQRS